MAKQGRYCGERREQLGGGEGLQIGGQSLIMVCSFNISRWKDRDLDCRIASVAIEFGEITGLKTGRS